MFEDRRGTMHRAPTRDWKDSQKKLSGVLPFLFYDDVSLQFFMIVKALLKPCTRFPSLIEAGGKSSMG